MVHSISTTNNHITARPPHQDQAHPVSRLYRKGRRGFVIKRARLARLLLLLSVDSQDVLHFHRTAELGPNNVNTSKELLNHICCALTVIASTPATADASSPIFGYCVVFLCQCTLSNRNTAMSISCQYRGHRSINYTNEIGHATMEKTNLVVCNSAVSGSLRDGHSTSHSIVSKNSRITLAIFISTCE
jgi:hypothetical protein